MAAFLRDGAPVEVLPGIPFTDAQGIQRPGNWLEVASPEERAEAGIRDDWPVEPDPPPYGQRAAGAALVLADGVVCRVLTLEPVPLAELRAARAAGVTARRDATIAGGFTFQGHAYQTRDEDRENIAGAAQLAFMAIVAGQGGAGNLRWADPGADFRWIAADNSLVPMDAQTTVAFGKAAAGFKQACIFAAYALKGRIEEAADAAALDAIDVTAGWPG